MSDKRAMTPFLSYGGIGGGEEVLFQGRSDQNPGHCSSKWAIVRNPLKLDSPVKKVFGSAFQDGTFVKVSSKSNHFYFLTNQI